MQEDYAIRRGRRSDLAQLPEVERAAGGLFAPFGLTEVFAGVPTPAEDFDAALRARRLWVATLNGRDLVGFAMATVVGCNAHLDELDVHPEHGRRGVGTALVERFLRWAREGGFPGATLTTLAHIPWNAPFYESLGFRVLEAQALPPALAELLWREIRRGLPAEHRVAMYRPLP